MRLPGKLVTALKHKGLQHVVLAHLSETNNTPEKALQEVSLALNGCNTQLHVATQDVCAEILQIQGSMGSRVIQALGWLTAYAMSCSSHENLFSGKQEQSL